jgi:hypothetical protein
VKEVVISNSKINSYGGRVLTAGIDLTQYERNPVLLWMHNRAWRGTKDDILPLGTIANIRIEGDNLIGTPIFDESDDFAQQIKTKWEKGVLKMASAGIDIIEVSDDPKYLLPGQKRATVTKSKLIEVSIVDIGSNDDSLQLYNEGKMLLLGSGTDNVLPEILIKNENRSMKTIALKLGLPETATETEILTKVGELQTQAGQSTELAQRIEQLQLANINSIVDGAVTAKKITADKKDHFIKLGKDAGVETLKSTLDCIMPAVKPTSLIHNTGEFTPTEYKKLSEVPSDQIMDLRDNNRAEYIKLYKAEYGFMPNLD